MKGVIAIQHGSWWYSVVSFVMIWPLLPALIDGTHSAIM